MVIQCYNDLESDARRGVLDRTLLNRVAGGIRLALIDPTEITALIGKHLLANSC